LFIDLESLLPELGPAARQSAGTKRVAQRVATGPTGAI